MKLMLRDQQYIHGLAHETLDKIEKIASAAQNELNESRNSVSSTTAFANPWTTGLAIQELARIKRENQENLLILAKEPIIARVVVIDSEKNRKTYYICRAAPVSCIPNLASYHSPVGRLAAIPVGDDFLLNGTNVEVLERTQLRPSFEKQIWDSRDSVIDTYQFGPVTIASFRLLLRESDAQDLAEDILGQLLAEEGQRTNIIEGIRRGIIAKMGLRDQPILDQYQDEIFRLPLNMQLLILGPPGTGKTTTLVRRLGQKLDKIFLDEDERSLIDNIGNTLGIEHTDSWLMFTPTELLQQYLKEAFARERVPASSQRIRTWQSYRRELARNTFNVLKTSAGGGTFILKDDIQSLGAVAINCSIKWFSDFDDWQRMVFVKELRQAATTLLEEGQTQEIKELGRRLGSILEGTDKGASLAACFTDLAREIHQVQAIISSLKDSTEARIKKSLNVQLNHNRAFIDELASFLDQLAFEAEDQDELEFEDEEDVLPSRKGRHTVASHAYMQTVRNQARAIATKRTPSKNSRSGRIIEWLGDRTLTAPELAEIGAKLLLLTKARSFANPGKRYIDSIPKRYRAFRLLRQKEGTWYNKDGFESKEIHPLELDGVLLAILRGMGDLVKRANALRNLDTPGWSWVKPFLALYHNQILVDEATDFSPIQLACMAALANPQIRSFFACGDFNQRLTTWGARSADELEWVSPDIEIREITVSYRQSRQLNELARTIIDIIGGDSQSASLPEHVDIEGVAPALLESAGNEPIVVNWLAERICEIERFVESLPSTAIFVNTEAEVAPIAKSLGLVLAEHNIQVVPCPNGQVMGQDNDVRVFDIQHIKGLEFEAVFFVSIDRLASQHPELFDKYLYVGTTRAATYLGVTCEDALPPTTEGLRPHFVHGWQNQ